MLKTLPKMFAFRQSLCMTCFQYKGYTHHLLNMPKVALLFPHKCSVGNKPKSCLLENTNGFFNIHNLFFLSSQTLKKF